MGYEYWSTEELVKKIDERKKLIEKFVNFIEDITAELGVLVSRKVGNCHTHVIMLLKNLRGLTFKTESGMCMMGGNKVTVWWRPGQDIILEETEPVMKVSYQVKSDLKDNADILYYNKCENWESRLKYIIANRDEMVKNFKGEQKRLIFEKEEKRKEKNNREQLEKEAERLKI